MKSTMVSLRRNKSLRLCTGRSSVLASLPTFCDNETAPQFSNQTKPDSVHPMPSNDVNIPEGNMTDTRASPEIISMLRDPAVAERVLLGLLGPDDAKIMQAYNDGGLRQNLAHHALAACLHLSMWLRENGDSSSASRERDEARACVVELEERVRNSEETASKLEAENEVLRHQVQEYESALNGVLNDLSQLRQKVEVFQRMWKEQEALHQEKANRLDEVLRKLEEANADLAKVTQSHGAAMEHIEKLTGVLSRTRQLYEQAEVEMKNVQQDCQIEKEERAVKRMALNSEMALNEDFQKKRQKNKKKKEDGIMLTPELNQDLNKPVREATNMYGEVEAQHSETFWTMCTHCQGQYFEYLREYLNHVVICPHCHNPFLAIEKTPPELFQSSSSSSPKQHLK